jgi:hypothetical protein
MLKNFRAAVFELSLAAGEQGLDMPPYKGSTLRGGFGSAFRKIVCTGHQKQCKGCLLIPSCPYAYVFETAPVPGGKALRNYDDVPRPFIFEPPLTRKTCYESGEMLVFNLILIGKAIDYLPYFLVAFQELGRMGIGRGRKPFTLEKVEAAHPITGEKKLIFDCTEGKIYNLDLAVSGIEIMETEEPQNDKLTVLYETMTRIKHNGHFAYPLEFHILVRGLLRRISSFYVFHHGEEWNVDYSGIIHQAQSVERIEDTTQWVDWERYSNRQQTRMNLGGVVGEVTYHGDIAPFGPILKLGEIVHVGKACTFGMGKFRLAVENFKEGSNGCQ